MEQQVLTVLSQTLSPDDSTRRAAEAQLQHLFYHPEGGLALTRITQNAQLDLTQRQSAGVLLQQYIAKHWSGLSVTFEDPSTPDEVKAQIRPIIFSGLSDRERKIRLASAFALSTIAKYDWPDEYPDLLSSLIGLLRTGSPAGVHGAMRVVAEFVKNDLSEDQLLPVATELLPALLAILGDDKTHSYTTRAECINVFRQFIKMLDTVREEHPAAVRRVLDDVSPAWLGAIRALLAAPAAEEVQRSWEALGLRIEIFRTLSTIQAHFSRLLSPILSELLSLTLSTLHALRPVFETYYLASSPDAPEPPSPTSDAGFMAPKNNLDDLACAAIDFLAPIVRAQATKEALVRGPKGQEEGTELLVGLVDVVGLYIRVTRENEEEWLGDANAFVQDEDDEAEQYSARTGGTDAIGSVMDKYPRAVARVLHSYAQNTVAQSSELKARGVPEWWKPLEGVLALLGGLSDDIRGRMEDDEDAGLTGPGQRSIELAYLFQQVVPSLLGQSDTPFLQGRAFVFASQFASLLPEELAAQYLGAAVDAMERGDVAVPVKLSAVKTVKNFCRFVAPSILQPQTGRFLGLLLHLLGQASDEPLNLVLETIRSILALDSELLTPETCPALVDAVYAVWEAHISEPVVTAITEELFETLSRRPAIVGTVVARVAPRLAAAIAQPVTDEVVHVPGEAVQLANALLRARGGPIEEVYVGSVTGAVIGVLGGTEDNDVIQHGMIHLTLVVRKDVDKLIRWTSTDGASGMTALMHLLARFLAPTFSESGGVFVGELIMHLFRKAGEALGGVLPELLQAVVRRLASATLPSFVQSLVLPFAYLFSTDYTTSTVQLLSEFSVSMPDGSERGALELVLGAWCETAESVSGSWNIRVTDLGMIKLFALGDERVRVVNVRGDLIVDETNRDRIMTRSRTRDAPTRYTQIPFPLKAYKLLLKDLQTMGKGKRGKGAVEGMGIDEDDGDEEWDDDDDFGDDDGAVGEFDYLSSWLDAGGADGAESQDDDEDLRNDPIAQIDLAAHLTDTIRQWYSANVGGAQEMVPALTDEEKGILKGVMTIG